MKYKKHEAKEYSREHMRGIWAAALNPMLPDFTIDEAGLRANIDHWIEDLKIRGFFIAGKQGEFFSMSLDERKRNFELAVEACSGRAGTIMSCSDQNFDAVIELAKHAQNVGADYIVVHAPVLHFIHDRDDTLFNYYKEICDRVDIGIAMWSHPDSGYLMSPELCDRIADLPNIMAIKYSVPRDMYAKLTELAGNKILVSTASEDEWFDNIVELGWQLYLCSSPPYLLQTRNDLRMHEYTELAMAGEVDWARKIRDSLEPVRQALKNTRPGGKPQAHQKYWQELLGQAGGPVRPPLLQLTDEERSVTKAAFESCGLRI
ncbi:MAG: dihydrodipicolinate synthase family protein [Rhizobiaceae bacterium]